MNLAILGASGGCGQQLVEQALAQGHQVTAVVRSTHYQPPAGVRVVRGEFTSVDVLREGVRGAEVVASALGLRLPGIAPWAKPEVPDFLSRTTPVLLDALAKEKVTRLIAISAGGVAESYAKVPAAFRAFIRFSALKHAYRELEVMEKLLLSSGLDVCVCRPTGLTDGPKTGQGKVVESVSGRATISRADVAAWMLEALKTSPFAHRTPLLTQTGA